MNIFVVIPAKAGNQTANRESSSARGARRLRSVWIPADAGMTDVVVGGR
jgi:hypothetical protein